MALVGLRKRPRITESIHRRPWRGQQRAGGRPRRSAALHHRVPGPAPAGGACAPSTPDGGEQNGEVRADWEPAIPLCLYPCFCGLLEALRVPSTRLKTPKSRALCFQPQTQFLAPNTCSVTICGVKKGTDELITHFKFHNTSLSFFIRTTFMFPACMSVKLDKEIKLTNLRYPKKGVS